MLFMCGTHSHVRTRVGRNSKKNVQVGGMAIPESPSASVARLLSTFFVHILEKRAHAIGALLVSDALK